MRSNIGTDEPAGLSVANLVGDPGAKVSFPPMLEVTLFGLTTRTIEGGPPPGLLAVIPWPLFDNNMILFPVEPAAATVEVVNAADVDNVVLEVAAVVEGTGARIYITRPAWG